MAIFMIILVFGMIALLLGGAGYYFTRKGWRGVRDAQASTRWPTTYGKILSMMVEEQKPMDTRLGGGSHRSDYRPVLKYSYTLNEKTYGGEHRRFDDDVIVYSSYEKAKAAVADYPVEKTVLVYYDPDNPANSVLEPGKAGPAWRSLTSGLFCFFMTLLIIWMAVAVVINQLHPR